MSERIHVKPTHDGTYTVYRGAKAIVSGLTRVQAERYEVVITKRETRALAAAHA